MKHSPTVGEAVRLLEALGITTVFGIPGVHTVELYPRVGQLVDSSHYPSS